MRVIIAGSRNWDVSRNSLDEAIETSGFIIKELVSGHYRGIDLSAEAWAKWNEIPVTIFEADWNQFGRAAGPIRNAKMAEYADALIAFWNGKSNGTLNMIHEMRRHNKPYKVFALGGIKLIDTFKPT